MDYYNSISSNSIYCSHQDANNYITKQIRSMPDGRLTEQNLVINAENETCDLPLFSERDKKVQETGGLNWGQRSGRDPNQAYILIPPSANHFTVTTDDGHYFIMSVAQQGDKALHTPQNNSLIGEYFRNRLRVPTGIKVEMKDLENYGRKYVRFTKLDEDDYYIDFSVNQ